MSDSGEEIATRLRLRHDPARNRAWLFMTFDAGRDVALNMVPNSIATRSAITPVAYRKLRDAGLINLDVFDIHTARVTTVLRNLRIGRAPAPDLAVQVRDIDEFAGRDGRYVVDGYLGLDYLFFGDFRYITIDTRTLRLRLRRDR